jgi:hypothetical protein
MYTWSNHRSGDGHITVGVDHFLVSSNFLELNLEVSSSITPYAILDHKPINIVFESLRNVGPLPFPFSSRMVEGEVGL